MKLDRFLSRCSSLTGNDESSLGCRQPRLSGQSMLGAALVSLVSVLGSNIADVKLPGRQYQVFSICSSRTSEIISRLFFYRIKSTCNFLTGDNWLIGKNVPDYRFYILEQFNRGEERRFNRPVQRNWYQIRIRNIQLSPIYDRTILVPRVWIGRVQCCLDLTHWPACAHYWSVKLNVELFYPFISYNVFNVRPNSFRARSSNTREYRVCIVLDALRSRIASIHPISPLILLILSPPTLETGFNFIRH